MDEEDGKKFWRTARESDFLLLVKRRKFLPQFERALREADLAYDSSRLGGLLNTLEIDDLIALLTVLLSPRHDLPLAQVLRSPIFGFTEQQMQAFSITKANHEQYRSWWDVLQDSQDASAQRAARFLEHWRVLAEYLPVHDLLDQIYQESNLRFEYAASAQPLARAQVVANLDAFLELSLNQDGGRYPSLGRFIDEMNAMRRSDDDETPDEGDVELESDADLAEVDEGSEMSEEDKHKRVRLMTIHGAKGLESPFVIILDANHTVGASDHSGVLLEWSPNDRSPSHLSMYTKAGLTSPRSQIREDEEAISQNENWNLLYVAMTRAKQGLWISGVAKEPTTNNPIGLDQKSWYARAQFGKLPTIELAEVGASTSGDAVKADKPTESARPKQSAIPSDTFSIEDFQITWEQATLSHQQQLLDIQSGATVQLTPAAAIEPDPEILEEGTNFHKLLEFLTPDSNNQAKPAMPSEQELMNWLGVNEEQAKKLLTRTKTVLETPDLKRYLTSGEWLQAWNELDITTEAGKSYRMDRLVELNDHLAILDYKLTIPAVGSEQYEKYRKQLQGYQAELTRIRQDKPNKAYLISSKGEIKEVV
jgi:ATP-dependent helicase/nuclease subunit A